MAWSVCIALIALCAVAPWISAARALKEQHLSVWRNLVSLMVLFLLGYGWNLGFVAGSSLLASGLEVAERTRLQGATDTIIWTAAAIASFSSGVIVTLVSYAGLGLLPALLVVTPAWLIIRRRRAIAASLRADEQLAA